MSLGTAESILRPALLADFEMNQQNNARDDFDELERILTTFIIPALGKQHPVSKSLYANLHNVRTGSGNFCWRHRHLGYSYSANEVGGAK